MLGRFLEFSIVTPDIRSSLDFYSRLGFSPAEVGEAWAHPYAVVTDGRIVLGLHQAAAFASSLTFVKPELLKHVDRLEQLQIALEFRRLGNDVFNEVGWLDPGGHLIRLVEARTFSPPKRTPMQRSALGYFMEIALPAPTCSASLEHWEKLGFVGMEEATPLPHIGCTSDTLDLGLYEPADVRTPALWFEADDFDATLDALTSLGVPRSPRRPSLMGKHKVMVITAPEGTPIFVTDAADPDGRSAAPR